MSKLSKFHIVVVYSITILVFCLGTLSLPGTAFSAGKPVKIGVLANQGASESLKAWSATADYLNSRIDGYAFSIAPLDFHALGPVVGSGKLDFVLTNPASFIELESLYGISRIATIKMREGALEYTVYGGVIFCRADRNDIHDLNDLAGKSFMAVDENSLGGWLASWRELKENGINPYRDFSSLLFGRTHDAVVEAVTAGQVDAGTVRTDTLQHLSADGKIDLHALRILHPQQTREFPFLLSTRLYPEWPFAKVRNTDNALAQQVVIALLQMRSDDPAALAGQIAGWTIPLDYEPVKDLLKELRLGPYKNEGKITLSSAIRQYWFWLILGPIVTLLLGAATVYVFNLNQRFRRANEELKNEITTHERIEEQLKETNSRLQTLIQAIPDVVFFKDMQARYLLVNKATEEFMGLSQADLMGKTDEELLPPDLAIYCRKSDEEVMRTRSALRFEEQYTRPNGEKGSLETIKAPIFNGNDNFAGLVGVSRDISVHKQTENALREAGAALERQLRFTETLLKAIPMPIFYKDAEGRYLGCNEEFSKIMGISPEEIVGKTVFDLWPLEQARVYHQRDLELLQNPRQQSYEFMMTTHAGELRHVVYSKDVFVDETGRVRGIIGTFLDITERKRIEEEIEGLNENLERRVAERTAQLEEINKKLAAENAERTRMEKALRESEKFLQTVIDTEPECITLLAADGTLTFMNRAGLSMIGADSLDQLKGQSIVTLLAPEHRDPFISLVDDIFKGKSGQLEFEVIGRHGDHLFLETHAVPLRNGNDNIIALLAISRNITEHKRDEENLARSYVELEARVLERTAELSSSYEALLAEVAERKKADGALRTLNATLEQRVADETEKRLEKERILLQQSKMATMGEMIGAIAHQWRQPLNVVGLVVQNMQDAYEMGRLDADAMKRMVTKTMTQIDHMSRTIDDFRNFMKPARDKAVFDTMRAAGNVLGLLSAQLSANDIKCRFSCRMHGKSFEATEEASVCTEYTIEGYKNEFEHVLLNLINNSRDAIIEKRERGGMKRSETGLICLDFFNVGDKVTIEVSDNGGGIRPEDINRIFEPYFTTKKPTKGTGLGLYMSKLIIEEHMNGSMSAKNNDEGATFSIQLPQQESEDSSI